MHTYTNQKDLRAAFWDSFPEFERKGNATQNSYPTDVRVTWVDWIDSLSKDGVISSRLAQRATL